MSVQIFALRTNGEKTFANKLSVKVAKIPTLFTKYQEIVEACRQHDNAEPWNLFYTIANCTDEPRQMHFLECIPFDIDGIDHEQIDKYHEIICNVVGVKFDETAVVGSGNGLHYVIHLNYQIAPATEVKRLKPHYSAICRKIDKALADAGLPGNADPCIFEARRILRLPGTENRKAGKETKYCTVIQPNTKPVDYKLEEVSGLPTISPQDALHPSHSKKYPVNDPAAIMEECAFLKWAKDFPDAVSEAQWYAALSITSRMNDGKGKEGRHWSHELSKGYKGYSKEETDEKMAQALESSGPRTCANIASITDKCRECKHGGGRITSPILITGPNTIKTEHTGFHNIPIDGKGKPKPNYDDLMRYFRRTNEFVTLADSRMVHTFDGTCYNYTSSVWMENFAQDHFNPKANTSMVREFKELVTRTNPKEMNWFEKSTENKINFQNGVLDLGTMELRPHSPGFGFRYVLPYEYNKDERSPTFEKMMTAVTGGDQTMIDVLMEYMGYCISYDRYWAHKALVLEGFGSNGKSTFVNCLKMLVGEGNYSAVSMKDLESEYSRQMLDGKHFNISEETPNKALVDSSIFKNLSSGGDLTVRLPYKEPYTIKNKAKLIYLTNEMPSSYDASFGYFRRILLVPFNQTFREGTPGYDPYIEEKLAAELPGIFNMALEGYIRLRRNKGFTESQAIRDKIREYANEVDIAAQWWQDNVTILSDHNSGKVVGTHELWFAFDRFCEHSNFPRSNSNSFGKKIRQFVGQSYGERLFQKREDGKMKRFLRGVVLNSDHQDVLPKDDDDANVVKMEHYLN